MCSEVAMAIDTMHHGYGATYKCDKLTSLQLEIPFRFSDLTPSTRRFVPPNLGRNNSLAEILPN
jgi:hypothetical protein